MERWIGVDYGRRRIGLALADRGGLIASPAGTLAGTGSPSDDAELVLRWAADHEAGGVVVGLPLNMDGSDSQQTRVARAFAEQLRSRGTWPVELWDERLSSFQADEHLAAAQLRPARRKALRDTLAAQIILQAFLDARRSGRPDEPPE
jgi:putative Holliday junction resolvase